MLLFFFVLSELHDEDAPRDHQVRSEQTADTSPDTEPSTSEPPATSGDPSSLPDSQQNPMQQQSAVDDVPLSDLLNQFVIIQYDGIPYPGKVVDIDDQQGDLQISCMHRIGPNRFFWPSKADLCWYEHDDILAVIPEPAKVTHRHCEVSPLIWNEVTQKLNI